MSTPICTADIESLTATLELKVESLLTAKQPTTASPEWHEHIARQVSTNIAATLTALAASDDDTFYISGRDWEKEYYEIGKLKSAPDDNVTAVLQAIVILTGSSQEYEDGVDVSWGAVLDLLKAAGSPRGLAGLLGALQDELVCSDASWHQLRHLLAQTGLDAASKYDGPSSSVISLLASWVLLTVAKHELVIGHALAVQEAEAAPKEQTDDASTTKAAEEEARVKQRECASRVLRACEDECKASLGPLVSATARYKEVFAEELAAAAPALEAASRGLQSLNKNALSELRRLPNPPAEVKLVLEALCVLRGVAPEKIKCGTKDQHELIDDYYGPGKRMINEPTFLQSLVNFDKDHLDPKVMARIRTEYIDAHPCFTNWELIKRKSSACAGLCAWLHGLVQYDAIINTIRPKRELLARIDAVLTEARALLPAPLADEHAAALASTPPHDDEAASTTSDWSVLSEWSLLSSSLPAGMRPLDRDDDARSECSWSAASAAAFEALDTLNTADISELRALKQPPRLIKVVFEAVQVWVARRARARTRDATTTARCLLLLCPPYLLPTLYLRTCLAFASRLLPTVRCTCSRAVPSHRVCSWSSGRAASGLAGSTRCQ